jgi:hypothetical protein
MSANSLSYEGAEFERICRARSGKAVGWKESVICLDKVFRTGRLPYASMEGGVLISNGIRSKLGII